MDPIAQQLIARLRGDPNDSGAYERLKARYREIGDLASLANLLEGWAGNNGQHRQAAGEAYAEAATAVLQSSGDRARAAALYRQALHLNVGDTAAAQGLRQVLAEAGEHAQLAEFLQSYATVLERGGAPPEEIAALYLELADVLEQHLGQPEAAQAGRRRAQSLVGSSTTAQAATGTHAANGEADALIAQYEQRIEAVQDPVQRASLLCELAHARAEKLDDLEGAILSLRQALTVVPGDIQVMHELATFLLARAERSDGARAQADHRRVAELFYRIAQGVDAEQAVAYLTSALEAMPEHDGALALLEELAPTLGRTDLLPGFWVAYLAAAGEGPETDRRRIELGDAYIGVGQIDDAVHCLKPVAERGDPRANELLQKAYAVQATLPSGEALDASDFAQGQRPPALPPSASAAAESDSGMARRDELIAQLRRTVHERVAERNHEEAADLCQQILDLDPSDPEAFSLLESHHRKRRSYDKLRDLLLASTRVPGLSVDSRKLRLREVATLSETKLREPDAAISAWRGVVTLDPADRDATRSLKRLLKKAEAWEELANVLEREAIATTDSDEKAALIREIALIHRDRRNDPREAADAFRQLHALQPDDQGVRDELLRLSLSLEQWEEAAPLLKEQLEHSDDPREQHRVATELATMLHEQLADHDGAYAICERALSLQPRDIAILERMERIDREAHDAARLLSTLQKRLDVTPAADRPELLKQMGVAADEELGDLDRAAEYLGEALDLAPEDEEALSRLTQMFERAGRYADLVELLRERTVLEKDPRATAALLGRIARTSDEHLGDEAGAAEAYEKLLSFEEDETALRFLHRRAARSDDPARFADLLRRLAAVVDDREEKRDLLFDLSGVLSERLGREDEAIATLTELVNEVDPAYEPAIAELEQLCERVNNLEGLALALQRKLTLSAAPELRLPVAKRLADLYEGPVESAARAIDALTQWALDDERDPEPHRRLVALLTAEERFDELQRAYDALSAWEDDFDARDRATIDAARVALEYRQDPDGAWRRLEPLVAQGHEDAETLLREIAMKADRAAPLAALYIRLAQEAEDKALSASYWARAAQVYEEMLDQKGPALEAALRRLAVKLSDREALGEVDRLAVETGAYPRLAQVYDRVLKSTQDAEQKVSLLERHAGLLEREHVGDALDRILRACALSPQNAELLGKAEKLAQRAGRSEELLVVYDRRIAQTQTEEDRVRTAIRAARLCDAALSDRERANHYLKAALAAAPGSVALADSIFEAAVALDEARPELGSDNAQRALIRAHHEIAERARPDAAAQLMLRAAQKLKRALDDEGAAFDALRQGTALCPQSTMLHEALLESALQLKRLDSLDAHIARLIDDAIDPQDAIALLRRRGQLLEGPLNRFKDAATVYTKLLQLQPDDEEAADKLRKSLRLSGRFQDLLLAINKQLQRRTEPQSRLPLLREAARTWERDLKNRWEALDAWKALLSQDPEDAEALAAVERLERGRGSVPDLEEALSGDPGDGDPTREAVDAATANEALFGAAPDEDAAARHAPAATHEDDRAALDDLPTKRFVDAAIGDRTQTDDLPTERFTGASASHRARESTDGEANRAASRPASQTANEAEDVPDLASLDASLSEGGPGVEELDLMSELDEPSVEVDLDDAEAGTIGRGRDASVPPPLPPGRRPPSPAHTSSRPPRPRRASSPPPLPASLGSAPPPVPTSRPPARTGSLPPPLPSRPPRRQKSKS